MTGSCLTVIYPVIFIVATEPGTDFLYARQRHGSTLLSVSSVSSAWGVGQAIEANGGKIVIYPLHLKSGVEN